MAQLKIFISSTCYDLGTERAELSTFLKEMGHDTILSDNGDVLFDPREHTHISCLDEVLNADYLVVIISGRNGGIVTPEALSQLDFDELKSLSTKTDYFDYDGKISITQAEVLKALSNQIPILTFIDSRVLGDHLNYEKNKKLPHIADFAFASIDNKESAKYIFEFVNFLRSLRQNNAYFQFSSLNDIRINLRKHFSALLQRLLSEQKRLQIQAKRAETFAEEFKDIKALILSTLSSDHARNISNATLQYRHMFEFFQSLNIPDLFEKIKAHLSWEDLLNTLGFSKIVMLIIKKRGGLVSCMIKHDGTFLEIKTPVMYGAVVSGHWKKFQELDVSLRNELINVYATYRHNPRDFETVHFTTQFNSYIEDLKRLYGEEEITMVNYG